MIRASSRLLLLYCLSMVVDLPVRAQWQVQSIDLKPGWNGVFLHVNADYTTLDAQVGNDPTNPILEVWRWNPPATTQFTDSPSNPNPGSEWSDWVRGRQVNALQRLLGDTAYLVRVSSNVTVYTWTVKGRPVPPRPSWTVTGMNFIGFSTVVSNAPSFADFLASSPELSSVVPDIYRYVGGELSAANPQKVPRPLFPAVRVARGQAFWVRAGEVFNRYFGPFEVVLSGRGVHFGDSGSTVSLRLRNLTTNAITVSLGLVPSAAPPAGQPALVATPPLLVRGELNPTNLTHGYTHLPVGGTNRWTLGPLGTAGAETEVVLGLNRAAITAGPGALLGGLLQFTDSLGHLNVEVPVSAVASSSAGLWVGGADVSEVRHYLKYYDRGGGGAPTPSPAGNYVTTNVDTSFGPVPQPFPLRLIVHNPDSGNAVLLRQVYYGLDANTNAIVSRGESALSPAYLKDARRITAVHLPWTAQNHAWGFDGRLRERTNLTTTVTVGYQDQAANPFLHAYHPDHDNLDVRFRNVLPQGAESFSIEREIRLNVTPPADSFSSLVSATVTLSGEYREVITLRGLARPGGTTDTRQFEVRGPFTLNRVSDIARLTPAP